VAETGGLEPISRESTASIIARRIRTAIMHGTFPPGSQLGELDLAAQLGVSRGPLREAMQRLVQEGLVRSERNRGLFVTALEPEDVRDVYLARAAVERAAVCRILGGDREAAARRLSAVHREMLAAARPHSHTALSDADLRFHEVLVEVSGSPRLRRMHQTLLVESRMCMAALQGTYAEPEDLVAEHAALVDGVREGDRRRLLRLVEAHMDDALRRLVQAPAPASAPAP